MRPRMLWLTSTLSTLSRLISNVRRLMKPVLWTTRILVTSVSVVQRWNQAFSGGQPRQQEEEDGDDPGRNRRHIEDPVRVGRIQHLFAGLQDIVDITPH